VGAEFSSRGLTKQKRNETLFLVTEEENKRSKIFLVFLKIAMTPQPCFSGVIFLVLYLASSYQAQRFEGKTVQLKITYGKVKL
jgi:hypothetical protein